MVDIEQLPAGSGIIPESRRNAGRALIIAATFGLAAIVLIQTLYSIEAVSFGFGNWRPVLYAYILWGFALGGGQVMMSGEAGHRALFLLPALLFTIALVIFPTFFGLYIAFTDWNLSAFEGMKFSGLANLRALMTDAYFWNALLNMVYYVLAVAVQYAIAFGLALLLNADIGLTLGRMLREELGVTSGLLVLDGLHLRDFDFVDLGRLRQPSGTVPVTIKSLIFGDRMID